MEDIKNDLLGDLLMDESTQALDILTDGENRYIKDFRLNMKSVMKPDAMTQEEIILTGLALAYNNHNKVLKDYFHSKGEEIELENDKISDAIAAASLLSANNVLYRFRHFMPHDDYKRKPAKMRMTIMARNTIGKELFELISLAISAVNGCEACVASHEKSLRELDVKEDKVWHAVRLSSVVESADRLLG